MIKSCTDSRIWSKQVHDDRSMVMRKELNQSMMGIGSHGTTQDPSVCDSCQCRSVMFPRHVGSFLPFLLHHSVTPLLQWAHFVQNVSEKSLEEASAMLASRRPRPLSPLGSFFSFIL